MLLQTKAHWCINSNLLESITLTGGSLKEENQNHVISKEF
jgi:hypothetical protein